MGTITTGVGLISGINTAQLIEQLLAIEARPKINLQNRISILSAQRTALLDINARLLSIQSTAKSFRNDRIFKSVLATTSNENVLTASAAKGTQAGSYTFVVKQLVRNSQLLTKGFADRDVTPLGLDQISFEFGKGKLAVDRALEDLNGGAGVARGKIVITDRAGGSATVDLTDVTSVNEVLNRINSTSGIAVTATVSEDGLVLTDTSGGAGTLTVANGAGYTTATDLGIAGTGTGDTLTGNDIFYLSGTSRLSALNDGNGVLIRSGSYDLQIQTRDGARTFSIDLGPIRADVDDSTSLDDLNNGNGISIDDDDEQPDIKITDRSGTVHEIDLTDVSTVGDLKARISSATGGAVTLAVEDGDHFVLSDTTGGGGLFKVEGAGPNGDDVATELGLLNVAGVSSDTITGTTLNNTVQSAEVRTVQELLDRINNAEDALGAANAGHIVASIGADGKSIEINDTVGGGGNLIIKGHVSSAPADGGDGGAAADLGIYTGETGVASSSVSGSAILGGLGSMLVNNLNGGQGLNVAGLSGTLSTGTLLSSLFNGQGITTNGDGGSPDLRVQDRQGNVYNIELDGLTTVQDLIDAFDTATGGVVTLGINGQALEATVNVFGFQDFEISDINGSTAATDLGIVDDLNFLEGNTITGVDTEPSAASEFSIINRNGVETNIDLSGAVTLEDIINTINASGAGVTASYNSNGTGLKIVDNTGGSQNLQLLGGGAIALGLSGSVSADTLSGTSLQRRYVDEATKLKDLNYGRGIGVGSFRITDGYGNSAVVSIGSDSVTLDDVIREINSRNLAINARVNDNGDGLIIEEDLTGQTSDPFVKMKIVAVNGSTAADLNIVGESDSVTGAFIDGSYERVVDLDATDDLDEVLAKINAAKLPVSASIVNTGSGDTPYRLSFSSQISGLAGELIIDTGGVDLGLTTLVKAQDAKIFFGSENPEEGFLITSSSNTVKNVVEGLTLNLVSASDSAVTINVTSDTQAVVDKVSGFVQSINDAIDRIDEYDFYDVEKEERGVLLSNPTSARVRQELFNALRTPAEGVTTQYTRLSQVGITVGSDGDVTFDEAKFRAALEADPTAVENLFTAFEATTSTSEEVVPGVTVTTESSQSFSRLGIGDYFSQLIDDLTNSVDGTLKLADNAFDSQIKLMNERIERLDEQLLVKRARLEAQFAAMESALAQLQNQSSALSSIAANVALSQAQLSG